MTDLLDRLPPEERARVPIDEKLATAGWVVQDAARANLSAGRGVAVREFILDIVFCDTRPLAEEWTYRFLAAALAFAQAELEATEEGEPR